MTQSSEDTKGLINVTVMMRLQPNQKDFIFFNIYECAFISQSVLV